MLKHQVLSDPKSCLNRAAPDEPVFVLRARDLAAAQTVRLWAAMAVTCHEKTKVDEALRVAQRMEEWRARSIPALAAAAPTPA